MAEDTRTAQEIARENRERGLPNHGAPGSPILNPQVSGLPDYGTPGEADFDKDAYENAAAQQQDDRPRHPDGRIVGQAPEGKKRRTKAQIEEDEAWEAAQRANEASEGASTLTDDGGELPQGPDTVSNGTGAPEAVVAEPPSDSTPPAPAQEPSFFDW